MMKELMKMKSIDIHMRNPRGKTAEDIARSLLAVQDIKGYRCQYNESYGRIFIVIVVVVVFCSIS